MKWLQKWRFTWNLRELTTLAMSNFLTLLIVFGAALPQALAAPQCRTIFADSTAALLAEIQRLHHSYTQQQNQGNLVTLSFLQHQIELLQNKVTSRGTVTAKKLNEVYREDHATISKKEDLQKQKKEISVLTRTFQDKPQDANNDFTSKIYSPNNQFLILNSHKTESMKIMDLKTGETFFSESMESFIPYNNFSFSSDSKWLTRLQAQVLTIWNMETKSQVFKTSSNNGELSNVSDSFFMNDKEVFISTHNHQFFILNLETMQQKNLLPFVARVMLKNYEVFGYSDQKQLFAFSNHKKIIFRNRDNEEVTASLEKLPKEAYTIHIQFTASGDHAFVVVAAHKDNFIYDVVLAKISTKTGATLAIKNFKTSAHPNEGTSLFVDDINDRVYFTTRLNNFYIYNSNLEVLKEMDLGQNETNQIFPLRNGDLILAAWNKTNNRYHYIDTKELEVLQSLKPIRAKDYANILHGAEMSADGKTLLLYEDSSPSITRELELK